MLILVVINIEFSFLVKFVSGKVWDFYNVDDKMLLFVIMDCILVYDVIMVNGVFFKGVVFINILVYWFKVF